MISPPALLFALVGLVLAPGAGLQAALAVLAAEPAGASESTLVLSGLRTADDKLDPRLRRRLASLKPGQRIHVSIWLKVPPLPQPRGTPEAQRLRELHEYMLSVRRGVVRALVRMGVRPTVPAYAPVVFASLTSRQIRQIALRRDVGRIYGPERNAVG